MAWNTDDWLVRLKQSKTLAELDALLDEVPRYSPPQSPGGDAERSPNRQPSQEEFWAAARAQHGEDIADRAAAALPPIVPVSYPMKRKPD